MKIWIEMSRDIEHGGDEWGFTKCIWAPTYKKGKGTNKSWLFWDNVNKVKSGDFILHLRGKGKEAEIVGYSIAKTDGYRTEERPPIAGEWAYCNSFYKAILTDYLKFENSINLYRLFFDKELELKDYYEKKSKPKNLFFSKKLTDIENIAVIGHSLSYERKHIISKLQDDYTTLIPT